MFIAKFNVKAFDAEFHPSETNVAHYISAEVKLAMWFKDTKTGLIKNIAFTNVEKTRTIGG
jgi:hypothetical protein